MPLKYRIFTEAGPEIGLGHLTRCTALYQAFREKTDRIEMVIEGSSWGEGALTYRDCIPELKIANWLSDPKVLDGQTDIGCAIFDSFALDQDMVDRIAGLPFERVFIDDWNHLRYTDGVVIDWTIRAEKNPRYTYYGKDKRVHCLLGAKYTALRKAFWHVPEKTVRRQLSSIMVSFGGSDVRNLTAVVLEGLHRDFPEIKKQLVLGSGFRNVDNIMALVGEDVKLHESPDAEDMKTIMLAADMAISSGGQTLNELARVGVPAIVVSVVDNAERNITAWRETGFIEYIGQWDSPALVDRISEAVGSLRDGEKRHHRSRVGRSIIDGNGARRIRDFLLQMDGKE